MSHWVGRALRIPRGYFLPEAYRGPPEEEPPDGIAYDAVVESFKDGRTRKPYSVLLQHTGEDFDASLEQIEGWSVDFDGPLALLGADNGPAVTPSQWYVFNRLRTLLTRCGAAVLRSAPLGIVRCRAATPWRRLHFKALLRN